ncbi:MAG: IPT/TIG domain-containing protein [Acidobacteriota bacterium]
MRVREKKLNFLPVMLVLALALGLGGCDTDSPTEPTRTTNPAPNPTGTVTGFSVAVSASPRSVVIGETNPVTITVVARRTDNNQFVPIGSTAVVSTTSGVLANNAGTATGDTVTVTFGNNGTAQASLTAPTETAVVRAQIQQNTGQATVEVTEQPVVLPLAIEAVEPNFGPPAGGTEVSIFGSGFSEPASVDFGGLPAQVLSLSSSRITVRTPQVELPAGQNLPVTVTVNINVGQEDAASDNLASGYTFTRNATPLIPKIISVTPTSGPNEGGTPVTIRGEAFGDQIQVFFGSGSRIEAQILSRSSTELLVETPPATGQNSGNQNTTVAVEVFDLVSGFRATLPSAFQFGGAAMFISAIQPAEGTYFGGTDVTIFGGGFEAPVALSFGGRGQQVVAVSGTEIVAQSIGPVEVANCARPSGAFSVVNIETNESFNSALSFTYRPVEPRVGGVSPISATADVDTGAIIGGPIEATISGGGFDRQTFPPEVTFGNIRAPGVTITSLDGNPLHLGNGVGDEMTLFVPNFDGTFPEEDCTTGTGTNGSRFTEVRVDVSVTARDTGCVGVLTGAFTYFPSDTTCRAAPIASFNVDSIAGLTVTVRDTSLGATSILWDFGDGSGPMGGTAGETRDYTYSAAGTFTIKLTAINGTGSSSTETDVTVPPAP